MKVKCPHCGAERELTLVAVGSLIMCRGCGRDFELRSPGGGSDATVRVPPVSIRVSRAGAAAAPLAAKAPPAPPPERAEKAVGSPFLPHVRSLLEWAKPGQRVSHYQIHSVIGFGGMGVVCRGTDLSTQTDVALKFLVMDDLEELDRRLSRFQQEAQIISRLDHPAIVRVHEVGQAGDIRFMSMELFLGPYGGPVNLQDYANGFGEATGLLDEADLRQTMLALLAAIGYAHSRGVVHCDVKPENVLLRYLSMTTAAGGEKKWEAELKLTDFGLAKVVGEGLVLRTARESLHRFGATTAMPADAAALIGTYDYMSPEQRRGTAATPTSDLFSVGIVMLRLLTGARELGLRQKPSSLRPGVHPGWDSVILRAIRENPQARHPSAEEMAHDIEEIPVGR